MFRVVLAGCLQLFCEGKESAMPERLQKIISASGLMSRRAAEELIAQGRELTAGFELKDQERRALMLE